jgi:hypothetical protein
MLVTLHSIQITTCYMWYIKGATNIIMQEIQFTNKQHDCHDLSWKSFSHHHELVEKACPLASKVCTFSGILFHQFWKC